VKAANRVVMKRYAFLLVCGLLGAAILAGQPTYNPGAPWRAPDGTVVSSYWLFSNKMHYAGTYSAAVTYGAQDLVIYAGTSYVSLQAANIAHTPSTSAAWWTIMGGSVTSVFGRAGAVVATAGDYTAAQVGAAGTDGTGATGTWKIAVTGNAGTATALAADPANCTSGSVAAGITAAGVAEGCIAATNANTASTIVQRDGSGNFSAGTITASLTGNASGNAGTATALAADPADCTNQFARGVGASGAAACASVAGTDFGTQTANQGLFGPASGSAAAPGFRALVQADMPSVVPACTKYTITTSGANWTVNAVTNDAVTAGLTQTITVASNLIPANGEITSLRIKHSTAFSGTAITAMTVSLGDGTTTNIYAPAFDVFQAVANTTLWPDGGAMTTTSAEHSLTATFTSVGANLTAISAGSVDVWACVRTLP